MIPRIGTVPCILISVLSNIPRIGTVPCILILVLSNIPHIGVVQYSSYRYCAMLPHAGAITRFLTSVPSHPSSYQSCLALPNEKCECTRNNPVAISTSTVAVYGKLSVI